MMDIEKLIEQANRFGMELKRDGGEFEYSIGEKFLDYATALSTLQAENKRLNKIVCSIPTTPDSGRTVSQYDKEMSMCAYLDDLEAENEKLRAELEQVTAERDAIDQDFRAFTKQWWEQDSGFPCRWCKFENSGGCEWKAKQPNEEKICAGRAFEWRGPQKED